MKPTSEDVINLLESYRKQYIEVYGSTVPEELYKEVVEFIKGNKEYNKDINKQLHDFDNQAGSDYFSSCVYMCYNDENDYKLMFLTLKDHMEAYYFKI